MGFNTILGQERALSLLQRALNSGVLAHAYLFHGPGGVGKRLTARQFIKALYCLTTAYDACDACPSCHKVDTGNHPDVVDITPDPAVIKIEQIRALQHRLSYKPYEGSHTSVLIDGCEFLSPPAANALLKTLEEPPGKALLLLLTTNREALPLTIISRCQLVPFRPLAAVHLSALLEKQGMDQTTARLAATLTEGGLDALDTTDLRKALAVRQCAYDLLHDVSRRQGIKPFVQARPLAAQREQCAALLRWLSLLCRDLVMRKIAPTRPLYNHDLSTDLDTLARHLSLEGLLDAFATIERFRAHLTMHINPQLLFERLVLHLEHILPLSTRAEKPSQRKAVPTPQLSP